MSSPTRWTASGNDDVSLVGTFGAFRAAVAIGGDFEKMDRGARTRGPYIIVLVEVTHVDGFLNQVRNSCINR